jgi:hypothetical protein
MKKIQLFKICLNLTQKPYPFFDELTVRNPPPLSRSLSVSLSLSLSLSLKSLDTRRIKERSPGTVATRMVQVSTQVCHKRREHVLQDFRYFFFFLLFLPSSSFSFINFCS